MDERAAAYARGVGKRVRRKREQRGMSATALARRADLSRQTIANIEGGSSPNPTLQVLFRVADALGVEVSELLEPSECVDAQPLAAQLHAMLDEHTSDDGE